MNALEQRLAETEAALFFALAEMHSGVVVQGEYDSQPPDRSMHPTALSTATPTHQQEKWDLMTSWSNQPLKNRTQAHAWLRSRQAATYQFVGDPSAARSSERIHNTFMPPASNASHGVDVLRPPFPGGPARGGSIHARAKRSRAPNGIRRERQYGARWLENAGIIQFDPPGEDNQGENTNDGMLAPAADPDRNSKAKRFARGNQDIGLLAVDAGRVLGAPYLTVFEEYQRCSESAVAFCHVSAKTVLAHPTIPAPTRIATPPITPNTNNELSYLYETNFGILRLLVYYILNAMSIPQRRAGFGPQGCAQNQTRTSTERPNKRRRTAHSRNAGNQETGLMRDGGLPRFVGSGSGIHFVRKVYSILGRSGNRPLGKSSRVQLQLVPGEDDQLHDTADPGRQPAESPGTQARKPFWSEQEVLFGANADFVGVTFELLVGWTRSYFKIWHPAFPFLHGPEVLEILENVANQGIENVSETDAAIVRSMMSISLADARQVSYAQEPNPTDTVPVPPDLVFLNLDHVASCTSFVLRTPASLKNMQAALCIELFLVSMLKLNMASRLGGSIVRMAYHLGLHRCPRRYPNFSPHEVTMRKRVWWSFYCLERLVCQALGLPLDVQDDDVDVCFPTIEDHQKTIAGSANGQNGIDGSIHQLQLFTLLSKHARLRGMVLELRHKSIHVRQDSIERTLNVQSELTAWSNEVHDLIINGESNGEESDGQEPEFSSGYDHEFVSPLYKTLLLVLQHESTITLNRPLLMQKPMTPASQAALQACIHASRAIIEAVDDQQGLRQNMAGNVHATSMLLAVWPLLTWSVWMSCFILTYAGLEGVTSVASAQRYAKRTLTILKLLSKRGTSWPESCAQAVEYLIAALEKRKSSTPDTHPGGGHSFEATPGFTSSSSTRSRAASHSQAAPNNTFARPQSNRAIPATPSGNNSHVQRMSHGPFEEVQLVGLNAQHSDSPTDIEPLPNPGAHATPNNSLVGAGAVPEVALTPHNSVLATGLDNQNWLFDPLHDPLSALDFSNFAQAGSADSAMGLTFY